MVELLLAQGADPSLRDSVGFRPLDHAAVTFSMLGSLGCGAELCQQLNQAMRWQARRQALLIRCKGDREHLVGKLAEELFRRVMWFL